MARSKNGEHRHRQPWYDMDCPRCGLTVKGRPTLPGMPIHIRAHFDERAQVCTGVDRERLEQVV